MLYVSSQSTLILVHRTENECKHLSIDVWSIVQRLALRTWKVHFWKVFNVYSSMIMGEECFGIIQLEKKTIFIPMDPKY